MNIISNYFSKNKSCTNNEQNDEVLMLENEKYMEFLEELMRMNNEISKHTFLPDKITYENINKSKCFDITEKEKALLEGLLEIVPEDKEIEKIYKIFLDTVNIVIDTKNKSENLLEKTTNLTVEILDFTNKVSITKSKHRISPDWDGKKQPLMILGNKLNVKRDQYIAEENHLNDIISELFLKCEQLHLELRDKNKFFSNILQNAIDNINFRIIRKK